MIKTLEVKNLNGKLTGKYIFHPDLNILTGKNGCGKTTILKLMWYFVSSNFDKIFDEMYFDYVKMELNYDSIIELSVSGEASNKKVKITILAPSLDLNFFADVPIGNSELMPRNQSGEGSLFFPTFRRIEGGFTITSSPINRLRSMRRTPLRDALEGISDNLTSSSNHKFIASVSTEDINYLLSSKYADISGN
jgi:hypothetical protein